ncbi:arginine deiminase-related protein [Patescibacteria group bacterium]|nr:arginine deiminase-related protein [Patescibacteria group bacterium]
MDQLTDTVLMISPDQFGFNQETAASNAFQNRVDIGQKELQKKALAEFEQMIHLLKSKKIKVLVMPSRKDAITPDAVFPNNWFSSHPGKLVFYPMLAKNRRAERQVKVLTKLLSEKGIGALKTIDLTKDENHGSILEGTGSLVLDRVNRIAYAMESPRTTKSEFDKWCQIMDYQGIFFHAYDENSLPIYHTNVVMSIGDDFAVIGLDAVKNRQEQKNLADKLTENGRKLIPLSQKQIYSFCANILQLKVSETNKKIVMSQTAFTSFTSEQKRLLEKSGEIIAVEIPTIEKVGGGSARCMMAEIFP